MSGSLLAMSLYLSVPIYTSPFIPLYLWSLLSPSPFFSSEIVSFPYTMFCLLVFCSFVHLSITVIGNKSDYIGDEPWRLQSFLKKMFQSPVAVKQIILKLIQVKQEPLGDGHGFQRSGNWAGPCRKGLALLKFVQSPQLERLKSLRATRIWRPSRCLPSPA